MFEDGENNCIIQSLDTESSSLHVPFRKLFEWLQTAYCLPTLRPKKMEAIDGSEEIVGRRSKLRKPSSLLKYSVLDGKWVVYVGKMYAWLGCDGTNRRFELNQAKAEISRNTY